MASEWSPAPPDSPGFWWLHGDEEFGTMGGNYTGSIPAEKKLQMVEVKLIGGGVTAHLVGICKGRMITLEPFDKDRRKPGYVGVWQKALLPELPE